MVLQSGIETARLLVLRSVCEWVILSAPRSATIVPSYHLHMDLIHVDGAHNADRGTYHDQDRTGNVVNSVPPFEVVLQVLVETLVNIKRLLACSENRLHFTKEALVFITGGSSP